MSPSTADSCKLLEYDAHYLKELTEEKEALAKNGKDNGHALRLLESGEFLLSFSLCRTFKQLARPCLL